MGNIIQKACPFEAGLKQKIIDTIRQYHIGPSQIGDSEVRFDVFTTMGENTCQIINYQDYIDIKVYNHRVSHVPIINQSPKHVDCVKMLTAILSGLAAKISEQKSN